MSNRIEELKTENQRLSEANRRLQGEEMERDKLVKQLRERVAELEAHAEVVNNYFYQIAEIVGTDEYAEEVDIIENLQLKAEELDYLLRYIDVDSKDEAVAEIERLKKIEFAYDVLESDCGCLLNESERLIAELTALKTQAALDAPVVAAAEAWHDSSNLSRYIPNQFEVHDKNVIVLHRAIEKRRKAIVAETK